MDHIHLEISFARSYCLSTDPYTADSLYFWHIDWFDADFRIDQWHYYRDHKYTRQSDPAGFARMIARHREQIRELLTNYGPIDQLSLDMCFPSKELGIWDDIVATTKMARRLQPQLLMRDRGIAATVVMVASPRVWRWISSITD